MDNTSCLVSVIIPVYNVRPYLEEALSSVIHQTYSDLEIIIIDDGSTDGSGEICDSFAALDRRIVVFHQENRGLSAARNVGLDHAGGDIISFMDPDDVFHPDMIRILMQDIRQFHADIAVCGYTDQTETRPGRHHSRIGVARPARNGRHDPARVIDKREAFIMIADRQIDTAVWNKLYDVAVWNGLRFPDGHVYEDIDTAYRVFDQCANVFVLAKPLYMYRKRSGSIMETCSKKNITDCILACSHVESFVMLNTPIVFSEDNLVNSCLPRIKAMIIYYALYSGDKHDTNELLFCDYIKRQIMQAVDNIGLDKCGMRISLCSFLISYWPGALRIIYKVYHRIRRIALIRSMIFINCIRESIFQYYD